MTKFYIKNLQLGSIFNENKSKTSSCDLVNYQNNSDAPATDDSTCNKKCNTASSVSTSELIQFELNTPNLLPQIFFTILGSWISLATGASLAFVTATLSMLQDGSSRVHATAAEVSWVASCTMLGALLGGLLSGPCLARGRRATLLLCAIPLLGAWVALANANTIITFYITHLVFGVCTGIGNDAAQLYVSEISHTRSRGALGCIPVAMFNFGTLLFYLVAVFKLSWHLLAWVGAGVSVPALLFPLLLPESPSYLASRCREKEALWSLLRLRGTTWDSHSELTELLSCQRPQEGLRARLADLARPGAMRPILLVAVIRLFSRFCGIRAVQTYTHDILKTSQSSLPLEMATFITGLVQFLSTLIACVIVERQGRRFTLLFSQGVMAASLAMLAALLQLRPAPEDSGLVIDWVGVLPLLCIALYLVANSLGLGPISGLVLGELVPQRHRSVASSVTGSLSWLAAFLVTKTYNDLNGWLQLHGTLYLYAAVCVAGMVFVMCALPETRGKSQLEIEQLFTDRDVPSESPQETQHTKSLTVNQINSTTLIIKKH